MLALFCLRLALGLLAALLLLRPAQINPRFYRTHFLTVLGLGCLALGLIAVEHRPPLALIVALGLAALGSMAWSLEGAPGGRTLIVLTLVAIAAALIPDEMAWRERAEPATQKEGLGPGSGPLHDLVTAGLLGTAMTAMLMGHSYLIAPSMSLTPLKTLLIALYVTLLLRAGLAGASLWVWTRHGHHASLADVTILLWLPLRWVLGLLIPAVLGVMAWQTTRIRNTQSSTGILYIVVVFVFLGELTAQLLLLETGFFL